MLEASKTGGNTAFQQIKEIFDFVKGMEQYIAKPTKNTLLTQ